MDCEKCTEGKYRHKFSGSLTNIFRIGRLYVNNTGKVDIESVYGQRYFLIIVEEVSRYTAVLTIVSKA